MSAIEYRDYAVRRAMQLRVDAQDAKRSGRGDIAVMLRASARVYIGCARFADRKVS